MKDVNNIQSVGVVAVTIAAAGLTSKLCLWGGREVLKLATGRHAIGLSSNQKLGYKIAGYTLVALGIIFGMCAFTFAGLALGAGATALLAPTPLAAASPLVAFTLIISTVMFGAIFLGREAARITRYPNHRFV